VYLPLTRTRINRGTGAFMTDPVRRCTLPMPDLSIIIPAWNEERELPATLVQIRAILDEIAVTGPAGPARTHELIVVDDASTDRTAEIALSFGARVERVEKRQIAAVRNAGAAIATGEYLIFIDADTRVPYATLVAALRELDAGAIGGGAPVEMEGETPALLRPFLLAFMLVWRFLGHAAGCFVFCRRDAFEAVGGFDERFFASEEVWLSKALKACGRFPIVEPPVRSSGRKLRIGSPMSILLYCAKVLLRGPKAWQRREGLDLWYDGRRE
jgi:glycosyltransferase involved in cell wall biosynthesis